jgi:hypothetical protein
MTGPDDEDERERRTTNLILLAIAAVVIGGGVWLVNAMIDARKVDECIAQGRRDCGRIDVPPRERN